MITKEAIIIEATKSDYEIYHKSYSDAITEVLDFIKKNGYEVSDEDVWNKISIGSKRPSVGKTTKNTLELYKGGKPTKPKRGIHFQVYGMERKYELNMYIN